MRIVNLFHPCFFFFGRKCKCLQTEHQWQPRLTTDKRPSKVEEPSIRPNLFRGIMAARKEPRKEGRQRTMNSLETQSRKRIILVTLLGIVGARERTSTTHALEPAGVEYHTIFQTILPQSSEKTSYQWTFFLQATV